MALPPLIRPTVVAQPTLDTATWFLQLRWVAVAGQLLTMAFVAWVMNIDLPQIGLLCLVSVTAVTNTLYWLWLSMLHRRGVQMGDRLPSHQVISALMLSDILVLTGMLYLSAGIANPFALFYFVNIAVAGAIVSQPWAWAVWATTVAGVFLLLVRSVPMETLSPASLMAASENAQVWTIPKVGFLVSFAACSGVITYFITILTGELRERERALQEAEDARLRNRQLEGLATLAAGAAHELASPLSTIAVVASELSRALEKQDAPKASRQDVQLIRSELDQCRLILDRMTSAAGEAAGERLRNIRLDDMISETLLGLRQAAAVRISMDDNSAASTSDLPVQAVAQALRNLIQNAIDASPENATVELSASAEGDQWRVEVTDTGEGMSEEVLQRIGEPFFTTKEPGRGMGLGLYLTENVVRRLNGRIDYSSELGKGTKAVLLMPTKR